MGLVGRATVVQNQTTSGHGPRLWRDFEGFVELGQGFLVAAFAQG